MGHDVFTNGRSNIHKGSGDKAVASAPDVCKTPVGPAVVPIPYPNISQSSTLKDGSKSVKINGKSAALKKSSFASSSADQAGSLGGVFSGVTGNKTEFINYSFNVKIEGQNVVRHMDATTHNKKNTIGFVYGSSTTADNTSEVDKKYKCDWKNCKAQHPQEIDYPDNGNTERGSYGENWKKPWLSGVPTSGKVAVNTITINHYKKENKVKHQATAAALLGTGQYATENHHLIPIKIMAKFKILPHNSKLIGFDINDGKYGITLPYFITDIFRHDLQSHKTSHPNYSKKVKKDLEKVEKNCKKYCDNENQQQLLSDLQELADDLREYVKDWDSSYLLRRTAVYDRTRSYNQAGLPQP